MITKEQIIDKTNQALIDEFELEPGEMQKDKQIFADLGFDSLDVVDMVIVLEEAFGFKLRDEKGLKEIRTLEDLYEFILMLSKKYES